MPRHIDFDPYNGIVVVFDLDDTLYMERDYVLSGFRAVANCGRFAGREDEVFETMSQAWEQGGNPYDALGIDENEIRELLEIYRSHRPEIDFLAGGRQVLDTLRRHGIRMGLITDGRAVTQRRKIEALGLAEYIDAPDFMISGEIGCEKTELPAWQHFVRRWPEAKTFWYVGDNPAKDFVWPNRLGWHTAMLRHTAGNIQQQKGVTPPGGAPEHEIASLTALLPLLSLPT